MNFQNRVGRWVLDCFGAEIACDRTERNHRFVEEAIELAQACGATASECRHLVDYVFGRPVGVIPQEVGGVMVTLAALCGAWHQSMDECGERELQRVWGSIEKIRAKQAAKPKHSPLPQAAPELPQPSWCIRLASGAWRTMDTLGMPDETDDPAKALCFSLREHADTYAQDDPDDISVVPRPSIRIAEPA